VADPDTVLAIAENLPRNDERAHGAHEGERRERRDRDCKRDELGVGHGSAYRSVTSAGSASSSVAAQLASRFSASSDLEPGSAV
jgi:hypothetical protein